MNTIRRFKKNYDSPTPEKWKRISDVVLAMQTCLSVQVPLMPISPEAKVWIVIVLNVIGVAFKFGTKFTTNEESKDSNRHYNNGNGMYH